MVQARAGRQSTAWLKPCCRGIPRSAVLLALLLCSCTLTAQAAATGKQLLQSGGLSGQQTALLLLKGSIDTSNRLADWLPATSQCTWAGIRCDGSGNVVSISLPGAGLTGSLPLDPTIWTALSSLQALDLSNNAVTGYLPPQLRGLTHLADVNLASNQLQGSLPGLPASSNLTNVNVNNNQFTGSLPSSWGNASSLTNVNVGNNQLNGSLPASWGNLTNAQSLNFGNNNFDGRLPYNWRNSSTGAGGLANLSQIAFGGNAGMCNAASGGFYYPDSYNTPCDNASSFTNHPGGYYMPSALSGPSIAPTEGPAASTGALVPAQELTPQGDIVACTPPRGSASATSRIECIPQNVVPSPAEVLPARSPRLAPAVAPAASPVGSGQTLVPLPSPAQTLGPSPTTLPVPVASIPTSGPVPGPTGITLSVPSPAAAVTPVPTPVPVSQPPVPSPSNGEPPASGPAAALSVVSPPPAVRPPAPAPVTRPPPAVQQPSPAVQAPTPASPLPRVPFGTSALAPAPPAIPVTGSNVSLQVTGANRFNFRDGYQQPYIGVLAKAVGAPRDYVNVTNVGNAVAGVSAGGRRLLSLLLQQPPGSFRRSLLQSGDAGLQIESFVASNNPTGVTDQFNQAIRGTTFPADLRTIGLNLVPSGSRAQAYNGPAAAQSPPLAASPPAAPGSVPLPAPTAAPTGTGSGHDAGWYLKIILPVVLGTLLLLLLACCCVLFLRRRSSRASRNRQGSARAARSRAAAVGSASRRGTRSGGRGAAGGTLGGNLEDELVVRRSNPIFDSGDSNRSSSSRGDDYEVLRMSGEPSGAPSSGYRPGQPGGEQYTTSSGIPSSSRGGLDFSREYGFDSGPFGRVQQPSSSSPGAYEPPYNPNEEKEYGYEDAYEPPARDYDFRYTQPLGPEPAADVYEPPAREYNFTYTEPTGRISVDKYESAFGAPAVQGGTGLVDSFTSARSRAASGTASGALSGYYTPRAGSPTGEAFLTPQQSLHVDSFRSAQSERARRSMQAHHEITHSYDSESSDYTYMDVPERQGSDPPEGLGTPTGAPLGDTGAERGRQPFYSPPTENPLFGTETDLMRSSDSFLQEATNPLYAQAPAIRSGGEAAGQAPAGSVTLPEALGLDTSSRGDPSHFSSSGPTANTSGSRFSSSEASQRLIAHPIAISEHGTTEGYLTDQRLSYDVDEGGRRSSSADPRVSASDPQGSASDPRPSGSDPRASSLSNPRASSAEASHSSGRRSSGSRRGSRGGSGEQAANPLFGPRRSSASDLGGRGRGEVLHEEPTRERSRERNPLFDSSPSRENSSQLSQSFSGGDLPEATAYTEPNPLFGSHQGIYDTADSDSNPLFGSRGVAETLGGSRNPLFGSTILDSQNDNMSSAGRGRGMSSTEGTPAAVEGAGAAPGASEAPTGGLQAHPLLDSGLDEVSASERGSVESSRRGSGLFSGGGFLRGSSSQESRRGSSSTGFFSGGLFGRQ